MNHELKHLLKFRLLLVFRLIVKNEPLQIIMMLLDRKILNQLLLLIQPLLLGENVDKIRRALLSVDFEWLLFIIE